MASVHSYHLKSGEKRYYVKFEKPGGGSTSKRGFISFKAAELHAARVSLDLAHNRYVDPTSERIAREIRRNSDGTLNKFSTVLEWVQHYLEVGTGLSRTQTTTERMESNIATHFVGTKLAKIAIVDLEKQHVRTWLSQLQPYGGKKLTSRNAPKVDRTRPLAPATVHKVFNVLSGAIRLAADDDIITTRAVEGIRLPKIPKAESKAYLTAEQVQALAEAVNQVNNAKQRDARAVGFDNLIYLFAYSGLRFGEAAALRVSDLDFKQRRIRVERAVALTKTGLIEGLPKHGIIRSVPLGRFLGERLQAHCARKNADDLVFPGPKSGRWMYNHSFRQGWLDVAAAKIGVPQLTPHDLRHTYASLSVSSGANIKALQKSMGHSRATETLDTYSDLFEEDYSRFTDGMDALAEKAADKTTDSDEEAA